MTDFKIGDKVSLRNKNEFIGYVSHINKGQLFEFFDPEITVKMKDGGSKFKCFGSELEIIKHE